MKMIPRIFLFLMFSPLASAQTVLVNDFPVSDLANTAVYRPMVAAAPNGSYAVTWGDERYGNTNRASGAGNIFGRIIGSTGVPVTPNFRVDDVVANTYYTDYWVFFSTPLFLPNGTLIVVWHVNGASGPLGGIQSNDIYYTAFNGATRLGPGVQLNTEGTSTGAGASRPSVCFRPPSTFLAVFEYAKNGNDIGGMLVDANTGSKTGNAFGMSDNVSNSRIYPHVASNGTYSVCVWTDGRTDTQLGDVYAERIVGLNGSANVRVNDDPAGGYNQYARVAMDAQGNYVVVWIDTRSNSGGDLYGQRFDAAGNRVRSNFKLTKSNSKLWEYPPGIAMKSDGSYVVTWADDLTKAGTNFTVKTRFFNASDQPLSDVIQVTTSLSAQPDVKIGASGAIIYAWNDGRENVNLGRIYSKIFSGFPTTAVEENRTPMSFRLEQNYPNPFNPSTSISYQLSEAGHVSLKVFDLLGRQVATLVDEQKAAGTYSERWDATNVPSGTYIYRLTNAGHVVAKTMTLMK